MSKYVLVTALRSKHTDDIKSSTWHEANNANKKKKEREKKTTNDERTGTYYYAKDKNIRCC